MIGSAIRKPRIHPGQRLEERRLDDRRPDDGEGDDVGLRGVPLSVAADQRTLAEGLGKGVGVRPPERLGPCRARPDHLVLHPLLAQALRAGGQQVVAGCAELLASRTPESLEPRAFPRAGLQVAAGQACRVDLGLPIHVEGVGVLVEQLLPGLSLVGAGHVCGRDRDQVGDGGTLLAACLDQRIRHPAIRLLLSSTGTSGLVRWRTLVEACRERGSAIPHLISVSTSITWPAPTRERPGRSCSTRTPTPSTWIGRPRSNTRHAWPATTCSPARGRRRGSRDSGIGSRGARRSRRPPAGRPLGAPPRGVGEGRDGPGGLGTGPVARVAGRLPLYQGPRRACAGRPPRTGVRP